MSDILITENSVKMTIEYNAEFETESEMIEAVKGATELRGLMPVKPETEDGTI